MKYNKKEWESMMPVIQDLIVEGYTLPEIARKLHLSYNNIIYNYKLIKNDFKYIDYKAKQKEAGRLDASAFIYTWESLSPCEKLAYYLYKQKHKAYYEDIN